MGCDWTGRYVCSCAGRGLLYEYERCSAVVNKRSPASENVPMIMTRTRRIIAATKIGTAFVMVAVLITAPPEALAWLTIATDTPHQVRTALNAAARNHAPKR